jgi:predicted nucleic acid-binding protein
VLISGFITPKGVSAKLFEQAQTGAFTLCLSREIIGELWSRLVHSPQDTKELSVRQ